MSSVAAAAAVIAGVVLLGPSLEGPLSQPDTAPIERSRSFDEGVPTFSVVAPDDGANLPADAELAFVWQAVAPGVHYNLTVTDNLGDVVWSESTNDTLARLPADVVLQPDQRHFWYVEALLPDGTTATTGASSFRKNP